MEVLGSVDIKLLSTYVNQTKMNEQTKRDNGQAGTPATDDVAVVVNFSKAALDMLEESSVNVNEKGTGSVLKQGSSGEAVKTLQKNLTYLGYNTKGTDGIFGNDTKNAVITFQKAYGLTADGIVGSSTRNKIATAIKNKKNGILEVGSRGTDVKNLQKNLTKLGYDTKGTDGIFGNDTKKAVMSFQKAHGLDVDGIVGTKTQNEIKKALSKPTNNVPAPSGNLTTIQKKMINNLRNDTSLGLSSSKKTAMVYAAERMFSDGYEVEFVAGMLGNIKNEGTPGKFESSAYITNPSAEPSYLVYMDNHFNYRSKFSGKTITQVGVNEAIDLQKKVVSSGYKGKFGLGMIQWTGDRTTGLLQAYKKYCSSNNPSESQLAKAEVNYMADELKGNFSYVYNNWRKGSKTAQSAGQIICKEYEKPSDASTQAVKRGNDAAAIYKILTK